MTPILRLEQASYGTVDLWNGTFKASAFDVQTGGDGWMSISFTSRDTDTNIRSTAGSIDRLFEEAAAYSNSLYRSDPVWLVWAAEGETTKRSLVYEGDVMFTSNERQTPNQGTVGASGAIALRRHPAWEATSGTSITAGTAIVGWGGTAVLPATTGTYPSRISDFTITPTSGTATTILIGTVWAGIRPQANGYTGFVPYWAANLGTLLGGRDATLVADTYATGGTAVQITHATNPELLERFHIPLSAVSSGTTNYDDMAGEYLVLGRMRTIGASDAFRLQLRHGFSTYQLATIVTDSYRTGGTLYTYQELGNVTVPPTGNRDAVVTGSGAMGDYSIVLSTERLSTGGTLLVDGFVFIPNTHMVYLEQCWLLNVSNLTVKGYTGPDDTQYAVNSAGAPASWYTLNPTFTNWQYPVGGGILVMAMEADTSFPNALAYSRLNEQVQVDMTFYHRWRGYRA